MINVKTIYPLKNGEFPFYTTDYIPKDKEWHE